MIHHRCCFCLTRAANKEKQKLRGSFTHSKHVENETLLPSTKRIVEDVSMFKRRSQTYHANFKNEDNELKRKKSRHSRKSRKSRRLSNPFLPASSKLISSSTSENEGYIEFHVVGNLGDNKMYTTEKAVNIKTSKPLVVKYFKVTVQNHI